MPIYEYECTDCGHKLDSLQKVTDDLLTDCPECNKPKLQRLISATSFQLKGTGWYATDFKTKPTTDSKATSSPNTTETKSTGTKTDVSTSSTDKTEK